MPPGFDPERCFGDEREDEDDEDTFDGDGGRERSSMHQPKLELSWKEKHELLHKIYDEGEIPPRLISDRSLDHGNKDGSDP